MLAFFLAYYFHLLAFNKRPFQLGPGKILLNFGPMNIRKHYYYLILTVHEPNKITFIVFPLHRVNYLTARTIHSPAQQILSKLKSYNETLTRLLEISNLLKYIRNYEHAFR